jgi:transcription initiation factor TFIIB
MWNSMTYKERSLYNIFDSLSTSAANSGIPPSIIDEAKMLYKQISETRISRGDNRNGLIASSIYMACKRNNVPRSAKEIAKIFNLRPTTMTRGCKRFQDAIHIVSESTSACDFIQRFSSKLNLNKEIKDVCIHVSRMAEELSVISENTPPSVASGCIYLVCVLCGVNVDKKMLTEQCDVSMVTISKCYKKLLKYRVHLFSEEMIQKYNIK